MTHASACSGNLQFGCLRPPWILFFLSQSKADILVVLLDAVSSVCVVEAKAPLLCLVSCTQRIYSQLCSPTTQGGLGVRGQSRAGRYVRICTIVSYESAPVCSTCRAWVLFPRNGGTNAEGIWALEAVLRLAVWPLCLWRGPGANQGGGQDAQALDCCQPCAHSTAQTPSPPSESHRQRGSLLGPQAQTAPAPPHLTKWRLADFCRECSAVAPLVPWPGAPSPEAKNTPWMESSC